jgi:hypothetical protein
LDTHILESRFAVAIKKCLKKRYSHGAGIFLGGGSNAIEVSPRRCRQLCRPASGSPAQGLAFSLCTQESSKTAHPDNNDAKQTKSNAVFARRMP